MEEADTTLRVCIVRCDGAVMLHLSGELDIVSAPDLSAAVDRITARYLRSLTIDLAEVRFVDLIGLRAIDNAVHVAQTQDARCRVVGLGELALMIARVAGLDALEQASTTERDR